MQQIAVKALEGLTKQMTVTVPSEQIQQAIDKRLAELMRTAKVKGFRPGKVPLNVVKVQYGVAVRQEVINEMLRKQLFEAIQHEKLNVAGMPHIDSLKAEPGEPMEFVASFEVYPEISQFILNTIKVEKHNAQITDQDLDRVLDNVRKEHRQWEEVMRPAALEDKVTIDFEGTVENEPLQGGTAKDMDLVLGSQSFIPGFEQGLVGKKAGESTELNLEFPHDYHHKEIAGKPVHFKVTVQKIQASKLPEFDKELMKKLGNEDRTVEQLRADISKNMQLELDRTLQNNLKEQVFEQLLQANPIEIPKSLLDEEISRMQEEFKERLMQQMGQKKLPEFDLPRDRFEEQAKKRVHLGLLFAEFIKANDLKVDDAKVRARIEEMASVYQQPEQIINWYYQNENLLNQVRGLVLEDMAIEKILSQATVAEKTISYEEAMKLVEPSKQHIESKG